MRHPPMPPGLERSLKLSHQLESLRELLQTPDGVLLVEGELKKTRDSFRRAYFPDQVEVPQSNAT